jgi:hypothetical protein
MRPNLLMGKTLSLMTDLHFNTKSILGMKKIRYIIDFLRSRALNFSIKGIVFALIYSRKRKLVKSDVLVICHDNSRTASINGLKYAPIIDTILDDLGPEYSSITLALPFSKYFGKSCYGNTILYNRDILFAYARRLIIYKKLGLTGVSNDPLVKAWRRVIKRVRPSVIVGVNPSVELCIAAREQNIWVGDIQHGILAPHNYYGLQKRLLIDQKGWPDVICCWDQFSKEFVDSTLSPYVNAKVIGHPLYSSISGTKLFGTISRPEKKMLSILITLDSLCPDSLLQDNVYRQVGMPEGLYNYILKSANCDWKIRLHPAQLVKKKALIYDLLERYFKNIPNVSWDEASVNPLPRVLLATDLHITYNSAATREAALYNIKTIILDPDYIAINAYFGDLIKSNMITMVSSSDHQKINRVIQDIENCKSLMERITSKSHGLNNEFKSFIEFLRARIKSSTVY